MSGSSKKVARDGLTIMQDTFVDRYLIHLNATKAAEEAGYKHPNKLGPLLLQNPKISAVVQRRMQARRKRTQVTQDRVIEEYARIAFANVSDFFEWDERQVRYVPKKDLSPEQLAALSEIQSETSVTRDANGQPRARIKLKVKLHDKVRALDALAKHLGLVIERHEVTGADGGPIEHRDLSELSDEELLQRVSQLSQRAAMLAASGVRSNGKNGAGPHANGTG